jgi:hypothetical protein
MRVTTMEIIGRDGENFPTLPLDMEWDAALAVYCERRWPVGRRKSVMREWGLSEEEARSVIEGKASKRTIGRIFKHKNGGWPVAIPIMGAVIGQELGRHIEERRRHEREQYETARHGLRRMARDIPAVFGLGAPRDD